MIKSDQFIDPQSSNNVEWLQDELAESRAMVRTLLRQVKKEQDRHAEVSRAYTKTVANLVEAMRENTALARECDLLRNQMDDNVLSTGDIALDSLDLRLTPLEVSAIRKAIARLHHPDAGGDTERMKLWNAALDRLEREESKGTTRR